MPDLSRELLLGLPQDHGYQLGTGKQTRFQSAKEITCNREGRVFILDEGNQTIIVYK